MNHLNRKGFTLVEMLAVVVILGILMAIMVPSVNSLLQKNKEDSYESLKNNIINATQLYFSDYRYEVVVDTNGDCDANNQRNVLTIQDNGLTIQDNGLSNSKLAINILTDLDYIKGSIKNPKDNTSLDAEHSYVTVTYNCSKKDFVYSIEDDDLKWE